MYLLDQIAEGRIEEAVEQGALDDLPGSGRPLVLDDDSMVPGHLRTAYRILKNSGFLPEEVTIHSEIKNVEQLIGMARDGGQRAAAARRLSLLRVRLGSERCGDLALHGAYYDAVAKKLGHE